ncbi:MAG: hypothetical protein JXN59_08070 [Anaerolineae bacterium]|nr:hypothetical protein [Anaerolineae bacterium]
MPVVFYTLVTLILTFPLVTRLGTHAAGAAYGDAFEVVRTIWWTKEALLNGMNPAQHPLLVYPDGFFSAIQWALPMVYLPGVPFALFFSPLTAYNLTFLLASVLTGWASFLFFRELVEHDGAALLGGLIVVAFPTRMGHAAAGHLGMITNYWRMLFLLSLVRVFRGAGWRGGALGGALCGLLLGFLLGTAPTNIMYEILPLLVITGGGLAWHHRAAWRRWIAPVMAMGGVAALIGAALYLPLLQEMLRGTSGYLEETGTVRYSTDLLAFGLPSPFNPVVAGLGMDSQVAWDVLGDNAIEGSAYLGVIAVLLAALALRQRWKDARPWLILGLACMLLSLGPVLKVADRVATVTVEAAEATPIALLPYAVLDDLPGLSMARTPGRFNLTTSVAVGALAAYGWAALAARLRRARWQGAALIAALALIMVEYTVFAPFPTTHAAVPAYFETLAAQGETRPVLTLPAGEFFASQWLLYDQTIHHQPAITGHVIRNSPASPALLALLNAAALPPDDSGFTPALTPGDQAALIRASGAAVVVVRHAGHNSAAMADYLPGVLGEPVYRDEDVTIFEVPEGPPPERVLVTAQGGWPVGEAEAARWLGEELLLAAYVPEAGVGHWTFEAGGWLLDRWLALTPEATPPDAFYVQAEHDGQAWQSSPVPLPAGFHTVRLTVSPLEDGCTRLPDEPACRGVWIGTPRLLFEDEDQAPGVSFGDKMRLVSWQVAAEAPDSLVLDLHWQALGETRADYTLFVHLLDADGALVTQWDGPLGSAEMPTSAWPQRGSRWQRVSVDEVLPGTYRLFVGLYTQPDITRLPVLADTPRAADGLYYLQDWTLAPSSPE